MHFSQDNNRNACFLGGINSETARVWMRSRQSGRLLIEWRPTGADAPFNQRKIDIAPDNDNDNTACVELGGLTAETVYNYRVLHNENAETIGEGRFETPPASLNSLPDRFSFALMSCCQPYADDGSLRGASLNMMKAMKTLFEERNVKFALTLGDQLYSDLPEPFSLIDDDYFKTVAPAGRQRVQDCSSDETRSLFHARYRKFLLLDEWLRIRSSIPFYSMLDDHEFVDNWGTVPDHQTEQWRDFGFAARHSYFDYQGSPVLPPERMHDESYDYDFSYGGLPFFVADLRSARTSGENAQLMNDDQWDRLERFFATNRDAPFLFLALSVPLLHLPRWLYRLGRLTRGPGNDFRDRWSSPYYIAERDALLKRIRQRRDENPGQRIVVLSGDIHIGSCQTVQWHDGGGFHQFISSGATNISPWWLLTASKWLVKLNRRDCLIDRSASARISLIPGEQEAETNPLGALNVGLVEFERSETGHPYRFRFSMHTHDEDQPRCAYQSPWQF